MKHLRSTTTTLSVGLALLASTSGVLGAPPGTKSTPEIPTQLVGSDTLNQVMDIVFKGMTLTGYTTYAGLGSTAGENQLEGSPVTTRGEPACLPADGNGGADTNPGCQEISPMSRPLDSSICEDEESANRAEGLAVAKDGLVIITNNAAHQRFADSAGQCPTPNPQATPNDPVSGTEPNFPDRGTGSMRNSGTLLGGTYEIGANFSASEKWKDVVRLIYTGCRNDQGNCASVPRLTRCTDPARQELVGNWHNIVQGEDCGTGACPNGLRHAYRRDDSSGTTQVFAELIGMASLNVASRTRIVSIAGAIQAISPTHTFCDGGQLEGFWPNNDAPVTRGDPLTTPCAPEDDLCGPNGRLGIVRAIRSPLQGSQASLNYPTIQCTRGRFARKQFLATSQPVCPDGTVPSAGRCNLPYFLNPQTQAQDFNCLNDPSSRPASVPATVDGRAYNYVVRTSDGTVQYADAPANLLPEVAQWRQNMATMDTVIPVPGGPLPGTVCTEDDATRQIGCLVANTTCTLGYGGRETAFSPTETYDDAQEPLKLQGSTPSNANLLSGAYPFARDLFINAIGGFENISADCLDRLDSTTPPGVCNDQVNLALEFYNMSALAQNALTAAGFIPFTESVCIGATGTATCGAPTVQLKTDCLPQ